MPSILQRANFLATSQHLLNVPSLTSYKRKFGASVKTGSKSDWTCMCLCLCRAKVSHPLPPKKIITRSFVDNVVKRFKHLATCQLSCNLTTSSRCAIFDELQEKIRSIASRPAQKVTGKSSEQSIKSVSQAACAYVCRTKVSPHLPHPTFPPTPPPQK